MICRSISARRRVSVSASPSSALHCFFVADDQSRGNRSQTYVFHPTPPVSKILMLYRETCTSLHRVYMGPQVFPVLLGWDEGVRSGISPPDDGALGALEDCADCHTGSHRQPILADEVQTFKALITVHKVLQEGHPIAVRDAQANVNWLESLTRGVSGEGVRGKAGIPYGPCEALLLMATTKVQRQI